MAVPKRSTSKAKTRSRRASSWKLMGPAASLCPTCSSPKRPHYVCPSCGYYKGRQALEVEA
ncbi:MAG: 50S ribosomal protein L32 [Ferrimicrobium sp.]|nr:50S ribosomal protein L32 [Ferrimicrobium sp.]